MLDRLAYSLELAKLAGATLGLRAGGRTTAADRIEAAARSHGDRPFLHFEGRTQTYAQWNAAANRVAHWGLAQGLGKGDVVALMLGNRPEYTNLWAGLAKLGATTALINTNLRGEGFAHALATSGAEVLILGSECLEAFQSLPARPRGTAVFVLGERGAKGREPPFPAGAEALGTQLRRFSPRNPPASLRRELRTGDDLFYIYTSGTTGSPKAARFSHLRFLGVGDAYAALGGFTDQDVIYCALPLYHTAGGVLVISEALSSGASVALSRRFSASRFWSEVRRTRATAFHYIGEFCRYLLNRPVEERDREHSLRLAIGNGLRPDIWEDFQERFGIPKIYEFYGATEGNVGLINLSGKVGSVGRLPFKFLMPARLVRFDVERGEPVRGPDGRCIECAVDEAGELLGRIPARKDASIGRFEGYTSEAASERKILRDVFRVGDAWFRTGDLLRCDAEGYFYFVDRIGDTFRWKGENVSTQEVAGVLSAFPDVEMVDVYGVAVPEAEGRAGMAALRLGDPDAFDPTAFYAFVAEKLPRYAAPAFVRLLKELPVTGTFKLRSFALQKQGFAAGSDGDAVWVREDSEQSYLPLTRERLTEIQAGRTRF